MCMYSTALARNYARAHKLEAVNLLIRLIRWAMENVVAVVSVSPWTMPLNVSMPVSATSKWTGGSRTRDRVLFIAMEMATRLLHSTVRTNYRTYYSS